MVYIADFEAFIQEAEDLYRASPLDTRYSIKYRHCDGKLVLKVTDDRRCLLFKTDQQQDLKKLERITGMFFALFATGEAPEAGVSRPGMCARHESQLQCMHAAMHGAAVERTSVLALPCTCTPATCVLPHMPSHYVQLCVQQACTGYLGVVLSGGGACALGVPVKNE
eukprot:351133-Chlamydomonas_euryale.AAC.8